MTKIQARQTQLTKMRILCITWKWPSWPIHVVKYTIFLITKKNSVCCGWRITSIYSYFTYCLNWTFRVKKTLEHSYVLLSLRQQSSI